MNKTNQIPSADEFPCEVFIKAIGKQSPDLEATILTIIKRYVPELAENAVQLTPSKNGNYLSVTVKIIAQNKKQLDDIYQEFSLCDQIIMAL